MMFSSLQLCVVVVVFAPAGRGFTLVARAYIKDSTYSSNMQSVY